LGIIEYALNFKFCKKIQACHGSKQLSNRKVFRITRAYMSDSWIGPNRVGIHNLNAIDGKVSKYIGQNRNENIDIEPPNNFIRAFKEESEHNMWVGSFGSGLSVYNPKTKKTTFYDRENSGLPSNYILAIHIDKRGTAWVGTNGNGIGV